MSSGLDTARRLVAEALEIDIAEIDDEAGYDDILEWDSLGHLKIIEALEDALGTPIDPAELLEISGVADIAALLDRA